MIDSVLNRGTQITGLAHFLDHYMFQLNLPNTDSKMANRVLDRALFYMTLLMDIVYLPAVSFFEMPLCRKLLSDYQHLFAEGRIVLVGDGSDLGTFIERRLREYPKRSRQQQIYSRALKRFKRLPPYEAVESDTTASLIDQWPEAFVDKSGDPRSVFSREHLLSNWDSTLDALSERMAGGAFIYPAVVRLFFATPNTRAEEQVLEAINRIFFDNFISILRCSYFGGIPYWNRGEPTLSKFKLDYRRATSLLSRHQMYERWSISRSQSSYSQIAASEPAQQALENLVTGES